MNYKKNLQDKKNDDYNENGHTSNPWKGGGHITERERINKSFIICNGRILKRYKVVKRRLSPSAINNRIIALKRNKNNGLAKFK